MESGITIRRLCAQDYDEALDFLNMVFSMAGRPHDFLKALPRMWTRDDEHMGKHIAVIRDGRMIGYLAAEGRNGEMISECIAESDEAAADILCGWLAERKLLLMKISVEAWRVGLIRLLAPICEGWSSASPCRFYLRSWDKLTDALLAMKSGMAGLPSGEAVIGVEGWGALHMKVDGKKTSVQRTEAEPEIRLSPAQAAQLLAGSLPPECVCELSEHLSAKFAAWFPLPLSWCTLDRV